MAEGLVERTLKNEPGRILCADRRARGDDDDELFGRLLWRAAATALAALGSVTRVRYFFLAVAWRILL